VVITFKWKVFEVTKAKKTGGRENWSIQQLIKEQADKWARGGQLSGGGVKVHSLSIICKVGPRGGGGYIYENNISNSIRLARSAVDANNREK
jgi:hypothetical protein